ncbi:Uma2 family endonuclease [Candidatus Poribacteria bacterium]|nr:Uma2 family endonuclease [Candidatus Poribacteria bacterium]
MTPSADLKYKHGYVLPPHPKACGTATMYLDGYPSEDDEQMAETQFHGRQIVTLSYQLQTFFGLEAPVYVSTDTFIYYQEGNPSKCVAPDVYVVFGVDAIPARRSFYTWAEGAVPAVAFEFLSEETKKRDRQTKPQLYLQEIGMQEYFIHQPQGTKPHEFRGWRRSATGEIIEIEPDERGALFSEALNLWFLPEDQLDKVRLMRPYSPDGTPLPTYEEVMRARNLLKEIANEAEARALAAVQDRREAEARAQTEAKARAELETELERLRQLLAQRST